MAICLKKKELKILTEALVRVGLMSRFADLSSQYGSFIKFQLFASVSSTSHMIDAV